MKTIDLDILAGLNTAQREAVTCQAPHTLVLAGAGSGKTTVLTQRFAWLVQQGLAPQDLLAVTFTNKAANEMRGRIETLLQLPTSGLWIGTFHGIAHRLLRAHSEILQLDPHFQILDSEDQLRLIKRLLKTNQIDDSLWPARDVQWFINHNKDAGLRPKAVLYAQGRADERSQTFVALYENYQQICDQNSLVDFAELLLRACELWQQNPDILAHYQARFRHLLVDEFQDTNRVQYDWLRLLAGRNTNITIVGDDDQSIYGWRGAQIENLNRFQQDFSQPIVIRLEQNYRSTGNILRAANQLIEHNPERMGKSLWTDGCAGEPITLYAAYNETDEARYIVANIQKWCDEGGCRREVVVLYRSNAQSRVLEETLLQARIPYRVYGGLRFFERAEIKDALGYLRLLANRNDDAAFERVVNTPTRGIGERSLSEIRQYARDNHVSLWEATCALCQQHAFSPRTGGAVHEFTQLIEQIAHETQDLRLDEQIRQTLQRSGLIAALEAEGSEKSLARIENLEELVNAGAQYSSTDDALTPLAGFLAYAVLESGDTQEDNNQDSVQLMTLHSAKGLEFKLVFMSGLEEELFPHRRSSENLKRLQEERRLCYVGITRAMQKLILTYAEYRRLHGRLSLHHPSRFIKELPSELIDEVRPRTQVRRPVRHSTPISNGKSNNVTHRTTPSNDSGFKIGQSVHHGTFGDGVILNIEGCGAHTKIQIKFSGGDTKWLMATYARLTEA